VVDETSRLEPARFGSSRSADVPFQLPLARLGAGEYLLSVEAVAGKNAARREVRFSVGN